MRYGHSEPHGQRELWDAAGGPADQLAQALATGHLPADLIAQVSTFIDEAPLPSLLGCQAGESRRCLRSVSGQTPHPLGARTQIAQAEWA